MPDNRAKFLTLLADNCVTQAEAAYLGSVWRTEIIVRLEQFLTVQNTQLIDLVKMSIVIFRRRLHQLTGPKA
ncbi:hypothetical protein [Xenorhabdus bovienii]|uniref:hypothetical protein n=1 Tax=Xenorhabdus bovienii TaxID=40576 RepID=UPI003DA56EC9